MFGVVVIGGGPAGVTAALRASELGANTALIESGNLGGTCTNDGCVPTRVLAKAARLVRDTEQFSHYGLSGEVPTVNFTQLLERTQSIVYRMHEKKQLLNRLRQAGVRVYADCGRARFVDPRTVRIADGTTVQSEKFIICAGGHARHLAFPGSEYALTHSDVWSLTALPRRIAIVGAAATGTQLASVFAAFGSETHLLEVAPRILAGEDEMVSAQIEKAFSERGISITTGIGGIERIEAQESGFDLYYKHEERVKSLYVDKVILAVGWPGNLEGLGLEAAGVETERGYIRVEHSLVTSAPHIFAAGDITGRMMLVQSAGAEGSIAAENAVTGKTDAFDHPVVPHGGFTDPEYGSVGMTEVKARERYGEAVAVAVVPYGQLDRAVIDGLEEGACKLIVSRESRELVGAHVAGEQAVEIVQLVAAGMATGMKVDQLAALELSYPTFVAILGLAARKIVRDLGADSPGHRHTPLQPGSDEWEWSSTQ